MIPTKVRLQKEHSRLSLEYSDGSQFSLPAEYLRVYSPSAEVRGHSKEQKVLQYGKKNIQINNIESSGNYALLITFSDGHKTGIYSWNYLFELATKHTEYWKQYLSELKKAGKLREPDVHIVQLVNPI